MKLGFNELLVILLIVVIVFGPTQIPKLTRMFGRSVKEFKEGMDEDSGRDGKPDESGNA